jgi:tight adherence protein C
VIVADSIFVVVCALAAFVSTTVLVLAATTQVETPAMRLARYARMTGRRGSAGTDVEVLSFYERIIAPLFHGLIELAASVAPSRARRTVVSQLTMAGSGMSPTVYLGVRTIMMVGVPLLAALYVVGSGPLDLTDLVVLVLAVVWGQRGPSLWLKRRIRARQRAIDRHLPYALDLMVACLEGGLSIDAALAKVVEQSDGPLASEIRKTLQELMLGRPTGEAIRDLGERNGAPGLKRLTEDMVQSDRMGISIAESLRQLARDSRIQRRQQAEELARKAPIKMVPVLIFCVLPALGIVTTAPAAILLIRTLARSTSLP